MKKACAIENHSIHQFKIAITSLWTSSSIYGPSTVPDSRLFISMSMLRKTNIHVIKVSNESNTERMVVGAMNQSPNRENCDELLKVNYIAEASFHVTWKDVVKRVDQRRSQFFSFHLLAVNDIIRVHMISSLMGRFHIFSLFDIQWLKACDKCAKQENLVPFLPINQI